MPLLIFIGFIQNSIRELFSAIREAETKRKIWKFAFSAVSIAGYSSVSMFIKREFKGKFWKKIQMKRGPSFLLSRLLLKCLHPGNWSTSHFRTLNLILLSSFSLFLFSFLLRSNPASPDANNKTPIDFNISRKYAVFYLPQPPQWISGKNSFIFIPTMPWKMGPCYFITSKLLL